MRKLLLVFLSLLLVTNLYAADTELQDLDAIDSPATGDALYVVDDPSGTPASRKITIGNLLGVANDLDTSGDIVANAVGATELSSSGVAADSYMCPTITVDADGRLIYAASGSLTGLSDVGSATQGAGRLLISDGSDFQSIELSGDISITGAGVVSIGSDSVLLNEVGDPSTATAISFDDNEGITFTTAEDTGIFMSIADSDADLSHATYLLDLRFQDDGSAYGIYLQCLDDSEGTPNPVFTIGANGDISSDGDATFVGTVEGGTLTEGGIAVYNASETPGGILGGTWETPTLDDTTVVAGSYMSPTITIDDDGRLTYAASGGLTGLSDVGSATQTAGNLLISDGVDFQSITLSGGATLAGTGVITLSESDPRVGTLTNTKWCSSNGTVVNCEENAPAGGIDELSDLSDVGSSTQTSGNLLISDGVDFQSITMSGDATLAGTGVLSVAWGNLAEGELTDSSIVAADIKDGEVGASELASTSVTAGSYMTPTITIDADGRITMAASGSLTGLSDVGSATQGAGRLLISDGVNFDSIAMSGDVSIAGDGITSVSWTDCRTLENPVDADDNIPLWNLKQAVNITDVYCEVDGGTSIDLTLSDGTNALEAITCDGDGAEDDGSIANGAFTARERIEMDLGSVSGTNTWLIVCVTFDTIN